MPMWAERVQSAWEAWHQWSYVPGRFRMDRVLKAAGVRDLVVENKALRDEIDALNVANGQLCAQAREAKQDDARALAALDEADHWHVYSVERGDPDGNSIRIEKVADAINEARKILGGRT